MSRSQTSKLGVREMTVIALVAVLILIAKSVLRMPIKLPGHAGVLWIAALIVGRSVVRYPGAGALMGLLGGTLVAIFQPSDAAIFFTIAKYVLPGLVLDALAPLFGQRFDQFLPAIVAGALAHSAKVAVDLVQGWAAGLTGAVLATGITLQLVLHIAFGALGGLVAALILRTLIRAQIPQLAGIAESAAPPGVGE
ncbi:MAG: hypothetical protein HGB10_06685 [Coriobacteriia bacterium]|nr:hypothetical protein [Coriobacteriia bacterium]